MAIVQTAVHEAVNAVHAAHRRDAAGGGRAVAAAHRASAGQAAAAAAAGHRRGLPGGPGADGRRPRQGRRHRRRRDRPPRACWPGAPTTALPRRSPTGPHSGAGRIRADRGVGGAAVAAAQALADGRARRSSAPARRRRWTATQWARDYNEVKALGSKASTQRTRRADRDRALLGVLAAADLPRASCARWRWQPGRDVAQNARLFAAASQAMDDALIAVLRGQVPLRLLAAGHRDPQRRPSTATTATRARRRHGRR